MLSDKDDIKKQIKEHDRHLQILKQQKAGWGDLLVPTHILTQIEDREKEIANLQLQLEELEKSEISQGIHVSIVNDIYERPDHELRETPSEISPDSPLLVGILIDVSSAMSDVLVNQNTRTKFSYERLYKAINKLVSAAIAYCRKPENDEVLPSFALFSYGYGFGRVSRAVDNLRRRLSVLVPKGSSPVELVRDLFVEIATKDNLPLTPTASDLETNWKYYRQSMEAQTADAILGNSPVLHEGLCKVRDRFREELKYPYYEYPLLLIVSSGYLDKASDYDLEGVISEIRKLGVQIISCYVGSKTITRTKQLYTAEEMKWPQEARRLFRCSSPISLDNQTSQSMVDFAREKGWQVPEQAKLFIQANHYGMLEEFIEIVLNPLKRKSL